MVAVQHAHLNGLPLQEALLTVCRILMLNELELLFLRSLLEGLVWDIDDEMVVGSIAGMKWLSGQDSPRIKQLHLYLLLAAYSVKVYLNDTGKLF